MINTVNANKRFEVLDSWRGICAVIVLLGHFVTFFRNGFSMGPLVGNNYIFVDFFFVLSGFVITRNYWEKIGTKTAAVKFAIVRWGRVYPLHLFILIMFIALEFARSRIEGDAMFGNAAKSLESLIGNLFLIHSMGFYSMLTWNFPSWSISVEFYTYLAFALLLLLCKPRYMTKMAAAIALIAPPALFLFAHVQETDITYDFGFIRCLGGFFAGVLVCRLYSVSADRLETIGKTHATLLEILMLVAVYLFAANVDNTYLSYASPYLFSVCVLVFAIEGGIISSIMKHKIFLFFGALSYSLYMTHAFVQRVMINGIDIVEKHIGLDMVTKGTNIEDSTDIARYFEVSSPLAWGLTLVMLVAVIIFSTLTYYFVEKPSYKWIKNRAG
ncbi:MAG: acyltransferase [Pseudobdellovibrionaceae bacterium]|jgi:peptidoglycan/LPS O-acetylase OafA/YrhL|nr:acyltransferase [Pseudobdellovibrionaceae bacterium]